MKTALSLSVGLVALTIGIAAQNAPSTPKTASTATPKRTSAAAQKLAEPATSGGPATVRRLNPDQYARSIDDIFGAGIKIPGRFDPAVRDEGLLAIGDARIAMTSSGFEQYDLKAREIAAQVLSKDKRASVASCAPAANAFDEPCARQFFTKYGRLLYRRPLDESEIAATVALAKAAAQKTGDFYNGMQAGLSRLLVSPNFVFRVETTRHAAASGAIARLDDYAVATRVSFLLWDAPPDAKLLDAAGKGELRTQIGLARQVDRLIASPRIEQGIRAFFSDMFAFEQFDGLTKDPALYAKFTAQVVRDAREQTLRTIVDLLVTHKGDYRDLFTTKNTFLNRSMGSLYRVQVDNAAFEQWVPYTFGANEPRAGILTLAGFLMLDPSHEGKSSPTIRGKSVRELFLCQKVPDPPGNVDFSKFQDPKNPLKTTRERLTAHRSNPVCAGCHAMMDPIGLAMENYDAVGDYRTTENGVAIDASGTYEGKTYKNAIELEKILHDSPAAPNCVARRVYEYGTGRPISGGEREWLQYLQQRFASDKYMFPALMRAVATSKAFQTVAAVSVSSN
jgi:hypothetical protein